MDMAQAVDKEREEQFQAEQDMRTLAEARRILKDDERKKRARKMLMEALQSLEQ